MSMIYDPVGDRMLVFGGYNDIQFMNDVWALGLSGTPAWQKLLPTGTTPPPRFGHTATYDPVRREMVVFGGYNGAFLNDQYVLSLSGAPAWSAVSPGTRPSTRDFHTVAYDPPRARLVLIGGNRPPSGALGDLWALDSATSAWTDLTSDTAWPQPRLGTFAVHDPVANRMVFFGGWNAGFLVDTWSLDLAADDPAWTRLVLTGPHPGPRVWHGEVYDPVRRRMLVIGGLEPSGGYLMDVWQLDLAAATPAWTQVATAGAPPAARECRGALYDPVRDRVGARPVGDADLARVVSRGGTARSAARHVDDLRSRGRPAAGLRRLRSGRVHERRLGARALAPGPLAEAAADRDRPAAALRSQRHVRPGARADPGAGRLQRRLPG
jgi:hypothetical protein